MCALTARTSGAGRPSAARARLLALLALLVLGTPLAAAQGIAPSNGLPGGSPDPGQGTPQAFPDLAVYSFGTAPGEPDSERPFRVCAEIQNYGTADPGAFSVSITIDGETIADKRYTQFPAAGDVVCGTTRADAGRHVIAVDVDYDHEVMEESESNNRRSLTITVTLPRLPDLTPTLTVTPDPPRRGGTITFAARIRNVGAAESGNVTVNFTYDGKFIARRVVPSLAPNHDYPVAAVLDGDKLREGTHVVRVTVDPENRTRELNEGNNFAEVTFTMPRIPKADLVVANVSYPDRARDGQPVNLSLTIRNQGDKPTGPFLVRVTLDNRTTLGAPRFGGGLAALSETNTTVSWVARGPGDHAIRVVVDAEDSVPEEYETNNEELLPFVVEARGDLPTKPDLVVERILHTPVPPIVGSPVNFTAVVKNVGVVASGRFEVAFSVDGVRLASFRTIGLPPGAAIASTASWPGEIGDHVVSVALDPSNEINEANETNNAKEHAFTVGLAPPPKQPVKPNATAPPAPTAPSKPAPVYRDNATGPTGNPDLRVKEVAALQNFKNRTTGAPEPRLATTIRNDGVAVEGRPFTAYFYLDDALVGDRRVDAAIRPEGRVVLTVPFEPTAGTHTMRVVVAYDGESVAQAPATRALEGKFEVAGEEKFLPAPALGALAAAVAVAALARRRRE